MKRVISYHDVYNYIPDEMWLPLCLLKGLGYLDKMAIGGSMGLVLNKLLKRPIKDIDLITFIDFYSSDTIINKFKVSHEIPSSKFLVGNDSILCKKINVFGHDLDLLYNKNSMPLYEEVIISDLPFPERLLSINLEDPLTALRFKTKYVEVDKNPQSIEKHKKDIYEIIRNLKT
jgi:hypothetical protein